MHHSPLILHTSPFSLLRRDVEGQKSVCGAQCRMDREGARAERGHGPDWGSTERNAAGLTPARSGELSVKAKGESVKEIVTVSNGVEFESKVYIIRR